jgi:predicted nucleotidyltransferase
MFIMIQKCSLWQVLGIFFEEPLRVHYVKEIARRIKLAPTSVKNRLNELLKQEFILKKKGEIFPGFIANRDNKEFLFYKRMNNLIKLNESNVLDYIIDSIYPETIIVYGSYLKGEDIESSDLDLLILSKVKKTLNLEKFEHILNRKIHCIIIKSTEELTKELRSEIVNGLVLYGYLKV